jgi:hypothetical protein
MKRPLLVIGCLFVTVAVLCFKAFSGAEEHQAAGGQAMMAKEAVTKVMEAHSFTPPLALPGPQGSVWYVSSRALAAHSVEQAVVGVRHASDFTVELSAFRRDNPQQPWQPAGKTSSAGIANLERSIKEQLQKELSSEEKSAKPAAPAEKEKAK